MKIAIPYDRGKINPHFGHSQYFEIYTVDEDRILGKMNIPSAGSGHTYMVSFMKKLKVDIVIAGHMGKPALLGLREAGIKVYMGLNCSAEDAVLKFLDVELEGFNTKDLDLSLMEDECDCH